jgi:hypothetical protein
MQSFDSRDRVIMAQALVVAMTALRERKFPPPPEGDIADMERMLDERFPDLKPVYEQSALLNRAIELGFEAEAGGPTDIKTLRAFIADRVAARA